MIPILDRRTRRDDQGPLRPGTITALSPTMCLADGTATAIEVLTGKGYTPAVGDRVGLIQFGGSFLALSVG